jgi:hypothetical protein
VPHALLHYNHTRSGSAQLRLGTRPPTSPGPQRSPTDISLAQLSLVDSHEHDDGGVGSSSNGGIGVTIPVDAHDAPPDYESPKASPDHEETPLIHPPIPSYDAAVAEGRRGRAGTRGGSR